MIMIMIISHCVISETTSDNSSAIDMMTVGKFYFLFHPDYILLVQFILPTTSLHELKLLPGLKDIGFILWQLFPFSENNEPPVVVLPTSNTHRKNINTFTAEKMSFTIKIH